MLDVDTVRILRHVLQSVAARLAGTASGGSFKNVIGSAKPTHRSATAVSTEELARSGRCVKP